MGASLLQRVPEFPADYGWFSPENSNGQDKQISKIYKLINGVLDELCYNNFNINMYLRLVTSFFSFGKCLNKQEMENCFTIFLRQISTTAFQFLQTSRLFRATKHQLPRQLVFLKGVLHMNIYRSAQTRSSESLTLEKLRQARPVLIQQFFATATLALGLAQPVLAIDTVTMLRAYQSGTTSTDGTADVWNNALRQSLTCESATMGGGR